MDQSVRAKPERIAWADLDDSMSSTDEGSEFSVDLPVGELHPETAILQRVLKKCQAPITLYLNNLPFDLATTEEISQFLGLSRPETASIHFKGSKPSGKGSVIVDSLEEARRILNFHGQLFAGRPLYMNLDGYFCRGQQYLKVLKADEVHRTKRRPHRRGTYTKKAILSK